MSKYKIDFNSLNWDKPQEGVRFKYYKKNEMQVRLVEFDKTFIEKDWCSKGHIGYILKGKMEINFNGNVEIFNEGDGLFIPAGQDYKHKAIILSDKVKIILIEKV